MAFLVKCLEKPQKILIAKSEERHFENMHLPTYMFPFPSLFSYYLQFHRSNTVTLDTTHLQPGFNSLYPTRLCVFGVVCSPWHFYLLNSSCQATQLQLFKSTEKATISRHDVLENVLKSLLRTRILFQIFLLVTCKDRIVQLNKQIPNKIIRACN